MAKVTRRKLPRGVELTADHVFDPIEGMATEINTSNVDTSQRKKRYGTFRVNFNIPWVDAKYFYDNRTPGQSGAGLSEPDSDKMDAPFYIPFCLPPVQEFFDGVDPRVTDGVPTPILDSIGLSFDQSDEPAAILSQWYGRVPGVGSGEKDGFQYGNSSVDTYVGGPPKTFISNPHLGKKSYSRDDAYEIELSIYEKEQVFFKTGAIPSGQSQSFFKPTSEVVSFKFPSTSYISRITRFNPLTVEGINREIDPYKTYIMAIQAPKLFDMDTTRRAHCAIVNIWVTMKFRMELLDRDTASAGSPDDVQNIPFHAFGQKGAPSVTVTPPIAGNAIQADEGRGIVADVGLNAIDKEVSGKLRASYGDFSMLPQTEQVKQDAAYEVITVPMGQGFAMNRMSVRDDYPFAPYVRGASYGGDKVGAVAAFPQGPYIDRRIIPIPHPMTIHHVVFAMNYTSDKIPKATTISHAQSGETEWMNASEPNDTVAYEVGVGMVSGVRGDDFGYQQIAYANWTNSSDAVLAPGQIDAVNMGLRASSSLNGYKLFSVPLVTKTGNNGKGYWGSYGPVGKGINGKPFFVGEGNTYNQVRTQVGLKYGGAGEYAFAGAGNPPSPSTGTEQYLEVRFLVDPSVGGTPYATGAGAPFNWTGVHNEGDIAIGYGGCWLYIIGKKHLT